MLVASLLLVGAVWGTPTLAQHTVTGTVVDGETGSSLPGVNIVVQGTQIGTTSRTDGNFTLEVPSEDATLVFSFVGYQDKQVPIEGRSEIEVQLQPAVTAMEEVVVNVGYQEQTIETTTGSVSQVSGEDLEVQPTTNLTQTLQGSVPGLIGVNTSGRPGQDNSNLLIRGSATLNNNQPLVVVDGVPGRQGGLARLDPSDIQNISVLKDASAAIYGSRAANGVILVETKEGRAGETKIDVNVERSWARPTVVPEMADAPTYMQMMNEIATYKGNDPPFSEEDITKSRGDVSDSYKYHNTDWYGVGLKDYSREVTASASVTGGGDAVRYRVSLNGATEDGILVNSGTGFDKLGFRSNLTGDVTENLNLNLNLHGRLEDRSLPAWNRGINAAWEMLQRGKPTQPAFWPNGKPGPAQEEGVNPVVANKTGYDNAKTYYFQSDLNLTYSIPAVEGWSVEGTVAYDRHFLQRKRWQEPWTLYSLNGFDDDGDPILQGSQTGVPEPRMTKDSRDARDILLRGTTTYEKSVGDHSGTLLLGTEWQSSDMDTTHVFRRFFPTDEIQQLFAGGTSQQDIFGSGSHSARLNFFGRANYDYKERYLLEVVARYDGSYIFPEGNRFGFFPSVSAGWRIAQEEWFNNVTGAFDRLKLRASYGQTGNDQIEPYQFLRTYTLSGQTAFGDGLGTTISQTRVPNPDVTWEVATQFDVGLEGAVLDNRLSFNLTYFNHFRDDILWFRSEAIPETAGFSLPRENIGQVRSTGYEAQVDYTQDVTSDLSLRVGANVTFAEDEIEYFAEAEGVKPWQENEGRPLGTQLYYVDQGIWNTQEEINQAEQNCPNGNLCHFPGARPGDVRFKDINGDGNINADDRRRIEENGRPDLIGGFNLGASYSQFDLKLQFQGAAQVRHYVFTTSTGTFGNFYQTFAEDRWTPDNKDASGPRAYQRTDPYWASNQNTFFLRDAKYLRLKAAQFTYTVPSDLSNRIGVGQFRVYLSGRNLFTLTPIEVVDPEIRNSAGHVYPPERAYTVGLRMGF